MQIPEKFKQRLFFGVRAKEGTVHDFSVRKVDGVFEKIYTHSTYATKHPQKWTARIVSAILESVGQVDIRAEFKRSEYMDIPKEVLGMTIQDASYVLLCGHMNTYGTKLDSIETKCPQCGKVGEFKCDLEQMEIEFPPEDNAGQVEVIFPDGGYRREPGGAGGDLGLEGINFNQFTFDIPTLAHAISVEKYYNANDILNFNLRIAQQAIVEIKAVEETPNGVLVLHTMPSEHLQMIRANVLLQLGGLDRKTLRNSFNHLDFATLEVEKECSFCGADVTVKVSTNELYPLV